MAANGSQSTLAVPVYLQYRAVAGSAAERTADTPASRRPALRQCHSNANANASASAMPMRPSSRSPPARLINCAGRHVQDRPPRRVRPEGRLPYRASECRSTPCEYSWGTKVHAVRGTPTGGSGRLPIEQVGAQPNSAAAFLCSTPHGCPVAVAEANCCSGTVALSVASLVCPHRTHAELATATGAVSTRAVGTHSFVSKQVA
jgi:hypothetical protein